MGAVASKTVADLRRRRLQSTVLAIVLFLGAGGATLALSILVETSEPFDHAFAAANGAHLVVDFAPAATDAQLAATATASGVTASAGPWPVAGFALRGKVGVFGGQLASGRPTPTDTIDRVTLLAGRWWTAPGEIVLDQDTATLLGVGLGASVPLLPDPAPDKDYQLWIISPESKKPVDAGIIPAASQCLSFSATQPVTQVAALAISLEPKGGSITPRGPVIYLGKF